MWNKEWVSFWSFLGEKVAFSNLWHFFLSKYWFICLSCKFHLPIGELFSSNWQVILSFFIDSILSNAQQKLILVKFLYTSYFCTHNWFNKTFPLFLQFFYCLKIKCSNAAICNLCIYFLLNPIIMDNQYFSYTISNKSSIKNLEKKVLIRFPKKTSLDKFWLYLLRKLYNCEQYYPTVQGEKWWDESEVISVSCFLLSSIEP